MSISVVVTILVSEGKHSDIMCSLEQLSLVPQSSQSVLSLFCPRTNLATSGSDLLGSLCFPTHWSSAVSSQATPTLSGKLDQPDLLRSDLRSVNVVYFWLLVGGDGEAIANTNTWPGDSQHQGGGHWGGHQGHWELSPGDLYQVPQSPVFSELWKLWFTENNLSHPKENNFYNFTQSGWRQNCAVEARL